MSGRGFIQEEAPRKCELCGAVEECRPYGPKGEQVCFACMKKNEPAARRQLSRHLFGEEVN